VTWEEGGGGGYARAERAAPPVCRLSGVAAPTEREAVSLAAVTSYRLYFAGGPGPPGTYIVEAYTRWPNSPLPTPRCDFPILCGSAHSRQQFAGRATP
jgi:hypothetical protein